VAKGKRSYTRRGPVGVVSQNVASVERHARLASHRLDSWAASGDRVVVEAREVSLRILHDAERLGELVCSMASSGFEPPERVDPPLAPGEVVSVKPEHRRRYEVAYAQMVEDDPKALDELVVEKILETGEVLVRRGRRTPFPARKSHLARRTA